MSLAEPRKRRKNPMHSINLTAPNHWTNDDSKFGQRMLEKFGWSKGSGLGKNQQGISENIRVQPKVTPTGLGFVAHNADDWFKAGEDYSRLLSQLTEKFDQYQALSKASDDTTSKKSLVENSLNSKSRVHYHKFTKGKDLMQYKKDELKCILGKGVKDDQSLNGLDMKEYFKNKLESKKIQILPINEDESIVVIDDEINKRITPEEESKTKIKEHEINSIIPPKKKKLESKMSKVTEILSPNECLNVVEPKKNKKKLKTIIDKDYVVEQTKKKKKKSKAVSTVENIGNVDGQNSGYESNSDKNIVIEPDSQKLILTHKYQSLVDLLIENSSAGKKYCKDLSSPLFETKMKEFADSVKHEYATTVGSTETTKSTDEETTSTKPIALNPDDKNFVRDFEAQQTKALASMSKRQEVTKYVNEKSMFIAKHGDVLFFGSNINDIKGYGDW